MNDQLILPKIHLLPENLQREVLDYIDFVTKKYAQARQSGPKPVLGSLKGTFTMKEDFDEPLEEFQDYM